MPHHEVAKLVCHYPDAPVLGCHEIPRYCHPVAGLGSDIPLVRPDVIDFAAPFGAGPRTNDHERVNDPIAIVVVVSEVHVRIGQVKRILDQLLGIPRIPTEAVVSVDVIRLRQRRPIPPWSGRRFR